MEQRPARHKHQSEIDPLTQLRHSFAKVGRQVRVLQRQGVTPPQELIDKQRKLDYVLTQQASFWVSHFGFKRGEPFQQSTSTLPKGE